MNNSNVKLRITPIDALGVGAAATTNAFTVQNSVAPPVNNNVGPTISSVVVAAKTSAVATTITWNESDSSGLGATTLTLNGAPATFTKQSSSTTAASYTYSGQLKPGTYSYTITAYNGSGKSSTFVSAFTVSATIPVIANVSCNATTVGKPTTIAWTVTDIDGIGSTTLRIDGVAITSGISQSGSSTSITSIYTGYLAAGTHQFTIDATDAAVPAVTASQVDGSFVVKGGVWTTIYRIMSIFLAR